MSKTDQSTNGQEGGLALPAATVRFHYIKSPQCVELPMHGAYGGINPLTGAGHMAVFTERTVIPQEVMVSQAGTSIKERPVATKEGLIRTINAVLYFDINTAIAVHKWLGDKIDAFKDAHPELFKDKTE